MHGKIWHDLTLEQTTFTRSETQSLEKQHKSRDDSWWRQEDGRREVAQAKLKLEGCVRRETCVQGEPMKTYNTATFA